MSEPVRLVGVHQVEKLERREAIADLFDVDVRTVDRWVKEGCPSETWGLRLRRFQPSRVHAWLREREQKKAA